MRNWIGKWVMFVSLGHTAVGVIFFGSIYREMLLNGLYNSVTSAKTGLAVWFVLFGFLLLIIGMLISAIEKNGLLKFPASIGYALLFVSLLGILLMPVSGFWLMFPAVFAILLSKQSRMKTLES